MKILKISLSLLATASITASDGAQILDIAQLQIIDPATEKLIKLQHGEAQKPDIFISENAVKESATLKNILEDIKADEALLPLTAYSYDLVFNVADLLKLINKNRSKSHIEIKEILINKLSDQTHPKSVQELIDLANFTNFLDIPILLDALLGLLGKKLSENKSNFYTIITGLQESNLIKNLVSNLPYSIERRIDDRKYLNASISADGSSIIAIGFDNYLYLFKDGAVTKLVDPSGTNRKYFSASISADGSSIIARGHDNYLYLFKDGAVTKLTDPSNTNRIYSDQSISADGSFIIARGLYDNYLYLFKDGAVTKLEDPSDTSRRYYGPSISADGSFIIATGYDNYLYLFKDGAVTKLTDPSNTNRTYDISSISADDSSIIARGLYDNYLYLFKDGAVTKLTDRYYGPSISADDSSIIATGSNGYLYLFKDGAVTELEDPSNTNRRYASPSISADGSFIIATGSDGYLYLFTRQAALKKLISQLDESEQKIVKEILETAIRE